MTEENVRRNMAEDMARGDEALRAARHLLAGGFYSDAVSRAYYAAFHWASALLLTKGIETRTHRGMVQMFSLHFVKNGPLSHEVSGFLGRLETSRELSDYTAAAKFSEAEAREEIGYAKRFIGACRPLVPFRGNEPS